MGKGKDGNMNTNNNNTTEMKKKIDAMETRIKKLETANTTLEKKVEGLESRVIISERVSEQLSLEVDRLDQYHRRPNVIVRNMLLPETETNADVENKVHDIMKNEIKLPEIVNSIDKLHRTGKVKEKNGKKMQDVIIRLNASCKVYSV